MRDGIAGNLPAPSHHDDSTRLLNTMGKKAFNALVNKARSQLDDFPFEPIADLRHWVSFTEILAVLDAMISYLESTLDDGSTSENSFDTAVPVSARTPKMVRKGADAAEKASPHPGQTTSSVTGQNKQVFISHVQEDAGLAVQIAKALEKEGYSTWYYERDSIPGVPYLEEVGAAIDRCQVVVLLITVRSLASNHVTNEVVRAYESGKSFVPLMRGITHAQFQQRQPIWRQALGAATSVAISPERVHEAVTRVAVGLRRLGLDSRDDAD